MSAIPVGASHAIASHTITMLVECRSVKCGFPGTPLLVTTGLAVRCKSCGTVYTIEASPHPVNPNYIQFLVVAHPSQESQVGPINPQS